MALALALLAIFLLIIIRKALLRKMTVVAERTANQVDDLVVEIIRRTRFFFFLILAVYLGSQFIALPATPRLFVGKLLILSVLLQGAIWGNGLFGAWRQRMRKIRREEDPASLTTYAALGFLLKIILWTTVLLLALDNLGVDITALVAGLGVGGIAVALALQNILGDLFASMSILLDKPFVIGDFIIVDNLMGRVEHIGLKTTRVRSLGGEQLVFSNSDLLKSRIKNFERMAERRVVFSLGVIYQTPPDKLALIPGIVQRAVEDQNLARFDRCHFKEFGDFALLFEAVYYISSPDYNVYMDVHQAVNLAIIRRFQEEAIEFAYPTQLVLLKAEGNPESAPKI